MKVIEDKQGCYGRYPIWFSGCKLKDIHEWLFKHYYGYKFCIVFDETKDEFEEFETPVPVYFADEVLTELAEFYDMKVVKK